MKSTDFERILVGQHFNLVRCGSHRVWSNGVQSVAVPHGKEINRMLARRLLKEIACTESVPEINYRVKAIA